MRRRETVILEPPRRLPGGAASGSNGLSRDPLFLPGGLAVEGYPGRVPGPAWEQGLPGAGGGPGALAAPHLPLHGIHLPRRGPALPGHLRGRMVPGQAPWQVSGALDPARRGSPGSLRGQTGPPWGTNQRRLLPVVSHPFCLSPRVSPKSSWTGPGHSRSVANKVLVVVTRGCGQTSGGWPAWPVVTLCSQEVAHSPRVCVASCGCVGTVHRRPHTNALGQWGPPFYRCRS